MGSFNFFGQNNLSFADVTTGVFLPLSVALILYWFYCLLAAFIRGNLLFNAKESRTYFIADRSLSKWFFIAAATATSFSGWTFISHPGIIYQYGFSAAYISFYAITIPLAGVFFLKRQWILGRRCGFVTPGEMFYAYFKSDIMRYLVLVVAILFSIFYIAVQLSATGYLLYVLTDYKLNHEFGVVLLSLVLLLYVTIGGLRAVAYMDTMQAILLSVGIITLGGVVIHYIGGASPFWDQIEKFASFQKYFYDNPKYFVVPSLGSSGTKQAIVDAGGNYWSATLILTFLFALMGIQSSPAFSMWAFATKDANAFGYQQVWASSLGIGLIMVIFTTIIGVGGHFLGLDYLLREYSDVILKNQNILGLFIENKDLLSYDEVKKSDGLVPLLIRMTYDASPILFGLLALSALAAIQSTAASYMSTVGSMLSRDLLKNGWLSEEKNDYKTNLLWGFTILITAILAFIPISSYSVLVPALFVSVIFLVLNIVRPPLTFGDRGQKLMAVIFSTIITISAIYVAISSKETLAFMGALAVAYGVQMMPALIAICWSPFFTKKGVQSGLIVGLLVVTATELVELPLLSVTLTFFGQWPWGIHSAFWGFCANLLVALAISFLQSRSRFAFVLGEDTDRAHREKFHRFLDDPFLQNVQAPKHNWYIIIGIIILWAMLIILPSFSSFFEWLLGQTADLDTWWSLFGVKIPPIWFWQIICLMLGIVMMYWLAFKERLSSFSEKNPDKKIIPLTLDISEYYDKYCEAIYPANLENGRK